MGETMKKILAAVLLVILASGYLSFRRFQHTAHIQGYNTCVQNGISEQALPSDDLVRIDCENAWINNRAHSDADRYKDSFRDFLGID